MSEEAMWTIGIVLIILGVTSYNIVDRYYTHQEKITNCEVKK